VGLVLLSVPITRVLFERGRFTSADTLATARALSAALRREPTGAATGFRGDVVATAKRDLKAGETLDGEEINRILIARPFQEAPAPA